MPEINGAEAQDFMSLVATRAFSDHIFGFFWNGETNCLLPLSLPVHISFCQLYFEILMRLFD